MKDQILKLIASSKNSNELADRICELMEEEGRAATKDELEHLDYVFTQIEPEASGERILLYINIRLQDINNSLHPTPEDSRRDVGKGTRSYKQTLKIVKKVERDGGKGKKMEGCAGRVNSKGCSLCVECMMK